MTDPAQPRPDTGAVVALLTVQVLFGSLPVLGKLGLDEFATGTFASLRVVGGMLLLVLVAHLTVGLGNPTPADLRRFALFGLFGVAINQGLFLEGLNRSTAVNATILVATIPALTYVFATLTGRERFGPLRAVGTALAFAGVLVIVDPRRFNAEPDVMIGNLLLLANSASYSWFLVISKPQAERYRSLAFMAWTFAFGAPLLVLPFAPTVVNHPPVALSGTAWLALGLVILGPTFGTYALNAYALRRVASSTVAVFIYVQPLVTASLASVVLGEAITTRHVVSAALVLAGVTLVVRRSRTGTEPPAA